MSVSARLRGLSHHHVIGKAANDKKRLHGCLCLSRVVRIASRQSSRARRLRSVPSSARLGSVPHPLEQVAHRIKVTIGARQRD